MIMISVGNTSPGSKVGAMCSPKTGIQTAVDMVKAKNQSEATIRDVKRSNNGQSDHRRSKVELEVIEKKQKWFKVKI